jgi:hypothetical protein
MTTNGKAPIELGTLTRVDARCVWTHEAHNFTPWLADNLDALGAALGLDLELTGTEAPCGDFALDILARDLTDRRTVIIENQLSATDHDHLGKLLTYAAGHDAGTIVWVAPQFRDEHRQALDWLNQRTDAATRFFAVAVEVLRIDNSKPAVQFQLVAAPNDWQKQHVGTPSTSAKGEAYRAFYQPLIDELREKHKFTTAKTAPPMNWVAFGSGISGIQYAASFSLGEQVRAEFYIDRGDAAVNKAIFDALRTHSTELALSFPEAISWERLDGKQASRVAVYKPGAIDRPAEELADIRTWLIDRLLRMKQVFGPRLKEAVALASTASAASPTSP